MMLVPTLLLSAFAGSGASSAPEVPVTFGGKPYTAEKLPADLSPAQRAVVTRYAKWAASHGYRMDFDGQGRLVLITHKNRASLSAARNVVQKAEAWFDKALPPATLVTPDATGSTRPASAPSPDDPPAKSSGFEARQGETTSSWGSGSITPDSEVAALFVLRNVEDYSTLLDVLAVETHYLKDWIEHGRKFTGFTVEDPLAGAYVENAAGQEEWDGNHELMNRTVQLLTLRRFGQQPNWLVQGIAWDCEIAADDNVYCFPFRSEFVYAAEHGAWPNEVKLLVKDLGRDITLSDVTKWRRGTWDGRSAKLAWGLAHHLIGQGSGRLSNALESMRVLRDEKDRRSTGPDSWERIVGFELSDEMQFEALSRFLGPKVLVDATNSMRSGRVSVRKDPLPAEKAPGK